MPSNKGVHCHSAKVTETQVREIRAKYEQRCPHCGSRPSMKEIAEQYGLSAVSVHYIIIRKTWKHVI